MQVGRVVQDTARVLLYASATATDGGEYHIIAGMDCDIQAGDYVEYEPFGVNFGWFVGKCSLDDEIAW